jgi:di/tricarboxylate transporter
MDRPRQKAARSQRLSRWLKLRVSSWLIVTVMFSLALLWFLKFARDFGSIRLSRLHVVGICLACFLVALIVVECCECSFRKRVRRSFDAK